MERLRKQSITSRTGVRRLVGLVAIDVLGLALLNVSNQHDFAQSVIYGLGGGLGFSLVLALFASLRERLAAADVPLPFRGIAIAMITAGLMSLAFMGFSGLIKS